MAELEAADREVPMKSLRVTAVLLTLVSVPCSGAMNLIVAPWGLGDGQYSAFFLPQGGRQGPQSFCIAEDGRLFVLDTWGGGRVIAYNFEGELLGQIPNEFPSAGYAEIEIEANRFLFLLDLARPAVNRIDLLNGSQLRLSGNILGASGGMSFLGKDLRGKVFLRDGSGRDIALDPQYDAPLLTLEVQDTGRPRQKQVRWRNTRIEFPIIEGGAIQSVRFLGQLKSGEIYLGIEIQRNDLPEWRVSRYHPDGWKRERRFRLSPPSAFRYRKPVAIDREGSVYELRCTNEDVRILKQQAGERAAASPTAEEAALIPRR